jgi:hypothetical protein
VICFAALAFSLLSMNSKDNMICRTPNHLENMSSPNWSIVNLEKITFGGKKGLESLI